ncbi:MAG: cyclic nucleotide-binding domain-containing protein [Sandaracinaceae bacterium]
MQTLADLRARADAELLAGNYHAALHAFCALLTMEPLDLDARLRLGDTLLALGEVQRAAVVYTTLARECAHGGHPLRALVAIKILTALEPLLGPLLASLAELYGRDSARLGRAIRVAPGDLERPLPEGFTMDPLAPLPDLCVHAQSLGAAIPGFVHPEQLPPIPLFSDLPADAFARVLGALKLRRERPGASIVREGEPGQSFFVLARGSVAVMKHLAQGGEQTLATLGEGAIFGEMALVSASPRTATVRCVTDCDLLEFDREALSAASREVGTVALALDKFTRERLLNNLLSSAPLFRPLDRKQRFDLIRRFTAHDVASGVTILDEGVPGRGLFVLLSGECDVVKRDGDSKVLLATLSPGDVFGEISLVNDEPTSAAVIAAAQSTVLFLGKDVFERLAQAVPEIDEYVRTLGEERQLDTRLLLDAPDDLELDEDRILI